MPGWGWVALAAGVVVAALLVAVFVSLARSGREHRPPDKVLLDRTRELVEDQAEEEEIGREVIPKSPEDLEP